MDFIYLDHNSTTPVLPAVWDAMRPFWTEVYGNPASAHRAGARARRALEGARERVAALLQADPDEVVFTSGATEANNLAIFGLTAGPSAHLISSSIEHPSALEPIRRLEADGFPVDWLPVNKEGLIQRDALAALLRPDTRLVSVMLANHETGAVQPVQDLVGTLDGRTAFHCDATQAVGKLPVPFHDLGVSTLSLSAHKFHGPKGIGALLVRRGTRLQPRSWGGHQQQGKRPGTEPVPLAVGLATALEIWQREAQVRLGRVKQLRQDFLQRLHETAGPLTVNGSADHGLPHTLNISFLGCQADTLLISLDLAGVACSTGSACSSGSLLPSPVLQAMGVSKEILGSAMRFSFSALTTEHELDEAATRIAAAVNRLRCTGPEVSQPSGN